MKISYHYLFLILLTGCESSTSSDLKHAEGETPVKYVICSPLETNCFIAARFKDISACQSHQEWADMLCDKLSAPGKMTCTQNNGSKIGVGYCTL